MPSYLHPGVYVEEIPSGSKPIEGVGTSTAAFIGFAAKGPIGEPTLISKWDDYEEMYGGVRDLQKATQGDPMGLSVAAFFQNGGTKAYIVRITDSASSPGEKAVAYVDHPDDTAGMALKFSAVNEGEWANGLVIKLSDNIVDSSTYDIQIGRESEDANGNVTFTVSETYKGVSLDSTEPLYIENVINDVSSLVTVEIVADVTATSMTSDQYLGTSTSGDLSGLVFPLEFSGDTSLRVTLDGNVVNLTLSAGPYDSLSDIAAEIQSEVRSGAVAERRTNFTCVAESNRLVLTCGSRQSSSSAVVDSSIGVASLLLLGSSPYIGSSISDDLSAVTFPFDMAAFVSDASRTLSGSVDGVAFAPLILVEDDLQSAETVAAAITAGIAGVTCAVEEGRLVLRSDTHTATSAVVITDSGIAGDLLLGAANGGTEQTGQGYFDAHPVGSELTGQQSADVAVVPRDTLDSGSDGGAPQLGDYTDIFTKFIKYRDINIICVPGQYWTEDSAGNAVVQAAVGHAEKMKNRMVIVDPPPSYELTNEKAVTDMGLPSQTYCVTYYPWVSVANRFYHAERAPGLPKNVLVPPSGYAAGMWAKIDAKRGVWKAAAGTETGLLGISAIEYQVEDDEQDSLNPWGINCLRRMPGAGPVIWGARTLATKADPEWRYVPVRRTAIMIEQSIYQGIQWAVFEPNDHRLWSALRANIGNFMNGLFRAGAFQGEKASDAYFVRCGLGDTMTQGDIDAGQVIAIVAFAPLKPAEFVIVRIQQKVNQQ